jgi:hypothetical protein
MSPFTRRPPRGRLPRLRTLRPRSRRAAVPLGLVLAVGGAASAAVADIASPADGGRLAVVGAAAASPGDTGGGEPAPAAAGTVGATVHGLVVERVTYTREDSAGGTLDVFVSAGRAPRAIEVSGEHVVHRRLTGADGHYEARVRYTGDQAPLSVRIASVGGASRTARTVEVDDKVFATAVYDVDARRLTVRAGSSDTLGRPRLTAPGYGVLAANGVLVAETTGTPADVTVTSAAGGSVTVPVSLTGVS